jgi:5-dehydro-2-deoxygluconokinase
MTFDLIAMGRIGVDLYPEQMGPLTGVSTFAKSLGGSAANVAVAAARYGVDTALVTRVGNDALGRYLIDALHEFDVDDRWVGVDHQYQTPVVIAELDPPEDPGMTFFRWPSAPDLQIESGDLDRDSIERARLLWVTGTGLSAEPSRSTTLAAMKWAQRSPVTRCILDLDVRPQLWEEPELLGSQLREAAPLASIVVGNRAEMEAATGTSDPEAAAEELLAAGVEIVIVKRGAEGVYVAMEDDRVEVPPIRVDVVCGLGAGDAFGGALCFGVLEKWPIAETVSFANAAGAIVASRLACADAMPGETEVRELLETVDA